MIGTALNNYTVASRGWNSSWASITMGEGGGGLVVGQMEEEVWLLGKI